MATQRSKTSGNHFESLNTSTTTRAAALRTNIVQYSFSIDPGSFGLSSSAAASRVRKQCSCQSCAECLEAPQYLLPLIRPISQWITRSINPLTASTRTHRICKADIRMRNKILGQDNPSRRLQTNHNRYTNSIPIRHHPSCHLKATHTNRNRLVSPRTQCIKG